MKTQFELEVLIAEEIERQFSAIGKWTGGASYEFQDGELLIELEGELNLSELARKILEAPK